MKIAVLVAALVLAPSAAADVGTQARESARLAPAASFVAGKQVKVLCAPMVASDGREGQAVVGGDAMTIALDLCRGMEGWLRGKSDNRATLAIGILALTHEAIHLRGGPSGADEGVVDCEATRRVAEIARRFFHVKSAKTMRTIVAVAWTSHSSSPPEYRTAC